MAFTVMGGRWRSLVLVLMLVLVPQVAQALVSEAAVLLEFQRGVIDIQANLFDWGSSSDPCNGSEADPWYGVTCSNQTVTELDLRSYSLRGTISEDWAGLVNLRLLDLSFNSLDGHIPESLIRLNDLTMLDLSNNQLTGSIPKLPPTLRRLYLERNSLKGVIDAQNLFNLSLRYLDLHGNELTGGLPDNLTAHSAVVDYLMYLDLSDNRIEGSLPLDLGGVGIRYIDLSQNKFVGRIPEKPWGGMRHLDLSGNQLDGRIPSQLFNKTADPIYLNLSGNSLTGFLSLQESTLTRIRVLDLSSNELENEGDIDPDNGMAITLLLLFLHNNRFSGNLNWIFRRNFSVLREVRVGGNRFLGGELDLDSNSTGVRFPFLRVMNLSGCGLAGKIPSEVFQNVSLPSLKILDLSNNSLIGTIPVTLKQMPSLLELRLQYNYLDESISRPQDDHWTNLEVLDLSNNSIHLDVELGFGSPLASSLLRELRLRGSNHHSKTTLPTIVGNLSLLEILDLSSCNLIGNISKEYSRSDVFPSLKTLDLSDNFLKGSLPEEFGLMPSLIELDVSNNDLSGALPVLPSHLLNSSFFAGNPKLCGSPLEGCTGKSSGLRTWEVVMIVVVSVVLSGGGCLFLGWIWRRQIDGKKHEQDAELIAVLLDTESTTSLMALPELQRSTDNFSEDKQIGVGGFGTVYRGTLDDGTEVAIKKSKQDGSSSEQKRMFLNEVKILSKVSHQRLVPLLGCCLANKNALLVFEFVENGTLLEHLNRGRGESALNWNKRLQIAVHTAEALAYLHSSAPPIYHLDVKSSNILLDKNWNAKVADFGISKLAPNLDSTHITALGLEGTPGYMDPEAVVDLFLTDKSDVYAFGVVLLELITAKPAVDATRPEDASLVKWAVHSIESDKLGEIIDPHIFDTFGTPGGRESMMAVAQIATRCLRFQSARRPLMREACADLLFIQQEFEFEP